ncbi:aminoglycoside phosphotransferase family protein [Streptomyces sp. NBC_00335]|uniref:phosphotransferase family protein n=1 Tax=unclassified Streptomyces TaxID=2593676 RepID=UPI002256898B|nr:MULTISPECIES: aminoglycoside phosphotransferase family protein [unclassified Streptomyces]MCX5409291.1 aminoglycoside phosphotransferase family protein [Streptomyces sp. NBC_00086]
MQRTLTDEQITRAVAHAQDPDTRVLRHRELAGGTFNSVHLLTLAARPGGPRDPGPGERPVVLKVAPPAGTPLMTYENALMRTEAEFYRRASTVPGLPVPGVVATGFDRSAIGADYLLMTHLEGEPWDRLRAGIGSSDQARLRTDLGRLVRGLHRVRGSSFGYPYGNPPAGAGTSWRIAFEGMLADVCADARRFGAPLPVDPGLVLGLVRERGRLLDQVTAPSLVHFDLWEGNILLAERDGRLEITGIIDGERAFWGDPLADLVSTALFDDITRDPAFLSGYRSGPLTADERLRIAMYRAYLALIVLVEGVPRGYDPQARAPLTDLAAADLATALDLLRQAPPV